MGVSKQEALRSMKTLSLAEGELRMFSEALIFLGMEGWPWKEEFSEDDMEAFKTLQEKVSNGLV